MFERFGLPTLSAFLLQIAGSIAARVLTALGIGIMAAVGADSAFDRIKSYYVAAQAEFAPEILQLMAMWGISAGINMILGALGFTLTMKAARKAIRFFSIK